MPIQREPDLLDDSRPARAHPSSEESSVRRAPLEHDDAYELQDHEFTLEPEEPGPATPPPLPNADERTAPWSTLPPLPAWATEARALLETPAGAVYDDQPTPASDVTVCSIHELLAMREELAHTTREVHERSQQIEQLERRLVETARAWADAEAQLVRETATLLGRVQGQAFLIAELEQRVRYADAALQTAAAAPAPARKARRAPTKRAKTAKPAAAQSARKTKPAARKTKSVPSKRPAKRARSKRTAR